MNTTKTRLFLGSAALALLFMSGCNTGLESKPIQAPVPEETSGGDQGPGPVVPSPETQPPPQTGDRDAFPQPALATAPYLRLMVHDDPATSVTVGFSASSASVAEHRLHYDTVDRGRDSATYANVAQPAAIKIFYGMNNAFVRLKGLKPSTVYYFVISDAKGVSPRYWFKTAPATQDARLSFVVGGDSRNNRTPRKNANVLVAKLRANAVIFGGDMTGGSSPAEWREWFEDWQLTIAADGRVTPVIAARGNHEPSNEVMEKLFDSPAGVYYGVTYADALLRVYTLNSESGVAGTQTNWLKADLAQSAHVRWKLAQYHRPMRPHTKSKPEGTDLSHNWAEVFYKYGMNLVSEADAHLVKSTWPIRPSTSAGSSEGFVRDDADGTVYIGEGGWGAPLRSADDGKAWSRAFGRYNHVFWVFVDRAKIEARIIMSENAGAVASVSDADPFQIPANLNVWNPSGGSVITILPRRPLGSSEVAKAQQGRRHALAY